jgi:peptidoglycan/LPS O-acetylase OafA/YrhL
VNASTRTPAEVATAARGHLPVLDGLRGLAIALVVVHNVGGFQNHAASGVIKAIYFLHAPGWIGVQLFFALSGFLITGILVDSRGARGALRGFWVRRALRIFPLYYAFLFGITFVAPLFGVRLAELQYAGWYWAYLCNFGTPTGHEIPELGHMWSLAVEEQFYLVWPLVVLALDARRLLRVCIALALIAFVARVALRAFGQSPMTVYEYTFCRMDALVLGGGAALVARNPAWLARVTPRLPVTLIATSVVLLGMWPLTRGFNREDPFVQTIGYGVLSVLFVALLLVVVRAPGERLARAASAGWLRWLGKYSYAIYVFHYPIAYTLRPRFEDGINGDRTGIAIGALVGFVAIVGALSVVAALVTWNVLERWALGLKDRLAPRARDASR